MFISVIGSKIYTKNNLDLKTHKAVTKDSKEVNNAAVTPPSSFYNYVYAKVSFKSGGEFFHPKRTVPHIDFEEYMAMKESTKRRFRKRYNGFQTDKTINKEDLFDRKSGYMPLRSEQSMDQFLKTASIYKKYKDQPIICLGRSPKWFLNAALWMKDGIGPYDFVAFSDRWYTPDPIEGMRRLNSKAPTEEESIAYKKYLKSIKADPKTIVEKMEQIGKKTVITDYICSGKGMTSFLDIMSEYAEEQGVLEQFSKAIQIVGIGSMEYMEDLNPYADSISIPRVCMPERLRPYSANIKQEFHDINYNVFREMLLNQNVNECRSTYYPPHAWTVYKPDKFKTGLIKDMKKVDEVRESLKGYSKIAHFTPAMLDFRNLLNFRILDALNVRGLLKQAHVSKV